MEVPVVPLDSHLYFLSTTWAPPRPGLAQLETLFAPVAFPPSAVHNCCHFCPERVLAPRSQCQDTVEAISETYFEESKPTLAGRLRASPQRLPLNRRNNLLKLVRHSGGSLRINYFATIDNVGKKL